MEIRTVWQTSKGWFTTSEEAIKKCNRTYEDTQDGRVYETPRAVKILWHEGEAFLLNSIGYIHEYEWPRTTNFATT